MTVKLRKGKDQSTKALMALRDMIMNGQLTAGERLYEVSLSRRIGISRTPLREALGRLEQEGFLDRVPSGGFIVRTFSFNDVFDSIELRGVLEGTAARLAAERGISEQDARQIRNIVICLDEVVAAGAETMNFAAYLELNADFHVCLAKLARSEIIQRELDHVIRLPFASPSAFLDAQSEILEFRQSLIGAQEQHRDMLNAIEKREGTRAEYLAREHAQLARKNLEYVMNHDRNLMRRVPGLSLVSG